MIKSIVAVLFLVLLVYTIDCSKPCNAATFQQAKEVMDQLQNISGYHISLRYSKDMESNAHSTAYCIIINQGMLNDCKTKGHLAMVLGHELAHFIMQDYRKESKGQEIRADRLGYYFCKKLGYKDCLGFVKNRLKDHEDEWDDLHPKWKERLRILNNDGTR